MSFLISSMQSPVAMKPAKHKNSSSIGICYCICRFLIGFIQSCKTSHIIMLYTVNSIVNILAIIINLQPKPSQMCQNSIKALSQPFKCGMMLLSFAPCHISASLGLSAEAEEHWFESPNCSETDVAEPFCWNEDPATSFICPTFEAGLSG